MKLRNNFIIKNVKDKHFIVNIKERKEIYEINETFYFIILNIEKDSEMVIEELVKKYIIDKERATNDYNKTVKILIENRIIEEE